MKRVSGSSFEVAPNTSPDDIYRPVLSQQIERITTIPYTPTDKPPSALKALFRLASAPSSREVGIHGPVLAAAATEHNQHTAELGLYQEIYPRDAYVSAQILWNDYPELTKATVLACLPHIGTSDRLSDANWIDEQEIGKIPHQIRDPDHPRSKRQYELRRRGYPYYGAIDTTQKTILAVARIHEREPSFLTERIVDSSGQSRSVADLLQANLDWILQRTSLNSEGLIESLQINPHHHANQSWADSPDSFHHANGSLARHHPDKKWGVASVEVNAETYDALLAGIQMCEALIPQSEPALQSLLTAKIKSLRYTAATLKQSLHTYFWVNSSAHHGGFFARGTDRDEHGQLHPLAIRSSDMGHLLASDILNDADPKVRSIITNLFSPEMLAANGIRTLSSDAIRYHKDAYHNGSVWPWDTYTIAQGLDRHGYHGLARELERRIMCFYQTTKTLAEYGSGGDTPSINHSTQVTLFDPALSSEPIDQFSVYNVIQPPQEIQAWTVATVLAIKHKNSLRQRQPDLLPMTALDPEKRAFELEILNSL